MGNKIIVCPVCYKPFISRKNGEVTCGIDCKNEASHIKTADRKAWVERVKRAERRVAPRKSCCMYDPISDDCTGLNALWCSAGACKFYKPRAEKENEDEKE